MMPVLSVIRSWKLTSPRLSFLFAPAFESFLVSVILVSTVS
jgi:hypothetical protein